MVKRHDRHGDELVTSKIQDKEGIPPDQQRLTVTSRSSSCHMIHQKETLDIVTVHYSALSLHFKGTEMLYLKFIHIPAYKLNTDVGLVSQPRPPKIFSQHRY